MATFAKEEKKNNKKKKKKETKTIPVCEYNDCKKKASLLESVICVKCNMIMCVNCGLKCRNCERWSCHMCDIFCANCTTPGCHGCMVAHSTMPHCYMHSSDCDKSPVVAGKVPCGTVGCDGDSTHRCQPGACRKHLCDKCKKSCSGCGVIMCKDCQNTCATCNTKRLCTECIIDSCNNCNDAGCTNCMVSDDEEEQEKDKKKKKTTDKAVKDDYNEKDMVHALGFRCDGRCYDCWTWPTGKIRKCGIEFCMNYACDDESCMTICGNSSCSNNMCNEHQIGCICGDRVCAECGDINVNRCNKCITKN